MEIDKISIDMINFFDVEGTIDLKNSNLVIKFSFEQLNTILGLDIIDLRFRSDIVIERTKEIYVQDKCGKKYSCIGCIFSYKADENVLFTSVAIDLILEDVLANSINIMVKKVTFKTFYRGHSIYSSYIQGYSFKYNTNNEVTINTYTDENFHIDISIENKHMVNYYRLSGILYKIVEFIKLVFGELPSIDEIIIETEYQEIKPHFKLVDKYITPNKVSNGKEILGYITLDVLNRETLKRFEKFRKDTSIIFDLYMINTNGNGYKEIQNCNLIQIMEGLYKTLINSNGSLRTYIEYFFSSKTSKKLLERRDKRQIKTPDKTPIFIYKSVNHRNYLSHLNMKENKNVFYKLENTYAYWKLSMAIRIFILEYINVDYDCDKVTAYTKAIDNWAKKNKLRLSSRINS